MRSGNTIDVFALGGGGVLCHVWWNGSRWNSENLGGGLDSSPVAVPSGGGLDVFAQGADGSLQHKWWRNGWGPCRDAFESLGGAIDAVPSVTATGTGPLDVFVRGAEEAAYNKWWNNGWHDYESLGGVILD